MNRPTPALPFASGLAGRAARRRLLARLQADARDLVVLLTFLPPLGWLLARVYDVAVRRLTRALAARPYVREVGLTGSLASGDCLHGASDVDLIVVAEGRPDPGVKREIRSFFRRARVLFPLVGETDERAGNLFFDSEVGVSPWAAIVTCRRKAGSYRRLAGRGPEPEVEEAVFTPVEVLAELTLQLGSIATQTTSGRLNLYFWKSKIRVLDHLLSRIDAGAPREFEAEEAELLGQLREISNQRLFFRRSGALDALAWSIVQKLVARILAAHGFHALESRNVAYEATPARQLPIPEERLPPGVRPHELARRPDRFGGDSLLDAPVLPHLLLEAADPSWATFRRACGFAAREAGEDVLARVWFGDFVVQFHRGRCQGVLSRYDRPFLFPEAFRDDDRLGYPCVFLDALLSERDADLDYLRESFYWRVIDPAASEDPARHGDSLRYFEDRERTLNGFAFIHLAGCLSSRRIVNFGDRDRVFAHAAEQAGDQRPLLSQLREYGRRVAEGSLPLHGPSSPPALIRASRRFFADRLHGRPTARDYGSEARLRLSLCVCTRNRAASLGMLLESVAAQARPPDEVVIVDNGSSDGTANVVAGFESRLPLRYVVDEADTIARLRNRAIAEATGDIVCFTDDDCVIHEGWLHFIEESFFLEEEIGIVGGRVLHLEESDSLIDGFHRAYLGVRL